MSKQLQVQKRGVKASRYPEISKLAEWGVVSLLCGVPRSYFFSQGEMPGVAGLVWCETMQNLVLSGAAASGRMLGEDALELRGKGW